MGNFPISSSQHIIIDAGDDIIFRAGGVERARIDENGNFTGFISVAASGGTSTETFVQPGTLATGVGAISFIFPFAAVINGVVASVGTAPTGSSIICDVNLNGSTIFSTQVNRPTIAATANKTSSIPTPNTRSVAQFDLLSVDIDQVGSTIPGADLVIVISYNSA